MCANWSRCSARASAFAPAVEQDATAPSRGRDRDGDRRAACTPGRRRRWSSPAASIAPVFPAETTASAPPVGDGAARPRRASESGFARTASAGFSCHLDHARAPRRARARRVSSPAGPKRTASIPSAAASSAPATISSGARSPPIASTAIAALTRYGARSAERLDLAALVRLAGRADVVRPLRRLAVRADVHARRLDPVLRAPLVATGLGGFLLRDCHERLTEYSGPARTRPGRRRTSRGNGGRASRTRAIASEPVAQLLERRPARVGRSSSSCACGSSFRSLPQTGQRPGAVGRVQRIWSGSASAIASRAHADELELVVDDVLAPQLVVVGRRRRLVLARVDGTSSDGVGEAAQARPVQPRRRSASRRRGPSVACVIASVGRRPPAARAGSAGRRARTARARSRRASRCSSPARSRSRRSGKRVMRRARRLEVARVVFRLVGRRADARSGRCRRRRSPASARAAARGRA